MAVQGRVGRAPATRLIAIFALSTATLLVGLGCAGEAPNLVRDGAAQADRGVALLDSAPGSDGPSTRLDGGGTRDTTAPRRDGPTQPDQGTGGLVPPRGASSRGSGGGVAPGGTTRTVSGVTYTLIVPSSYSASKATRLMLVYSGTEGMGVMTQNLRSIASQPQLGLGDVIFAVLDGVKTFGNGQTGVVVLDDVRKRYNIDNDRTFLLSESAGTRAGLQLGLQLRQSYFAAYWANDVNANSKPAKNAAQLGFAPWGNAGPGGALAHAQAIVAGMKAAGYRLPADAPYSGSGSTQHGNPQQFLAALAFFRGKSR